MDKAKALTGKRAGEWVKANQPKLSYQACKDWKLYCPTCYQPVHLRKSKKIKNYFAHYDFEDKSCPERNQAFNNSNSGYLMESHDQDLEEVETFIEKIFYGIEPTYFQSLNLEKLKSDKNSILVTHSVAWFASHVETDLKRWVHYYCKTHGFLDWNNFKKETNYILDCIHILVERQSILRNILHYSTALYVSPKMQSDPIRREFGLSKILIEEESSISLITLNLIINRLKQVAISGIDFNPAEIQIVQEFIDIKIPANTRKIKFNKTRRIFISPLPILVGNRKNQGISYYITFKEESKNCFWFDAIKHVSDDEISKNDNTKDDTQKLSSNILAVRGVTSKETVYQKEKDRSKKEKPGKPNLDIRSSLELYIDDENDLAVRGYIQKKYTKAVLRGLAKIFFSKADPSMLTLHQNSFISEKVAQKVAQLALKEEYGDLGESQALKKFIALSKASSRSVMY